MEILFALFNFNPVVSTFVPLFVLCHHCGVYSIIRINNGVLGCNSYIKNSSNEIP